MLVGVVHKNSLAECRALLRQPGLAQFDILELRLDACADLSLAGAAELLASSPLPVIFTLRSRAEGGGWRGSEEERLDLLEKLVRLQPAGLDLEAHLPAEAIARLRSLSPATRLILSRHDFEKTPPSLAGFESILAEMRRKFDQREVVYKIACLAQNTPDALRMLAFCREQRQGGLQLAGISLGEYGQSTRILANWAHGTLCYCPAEPGGAEQNVSLAGLGQVRAAELFNIYNFQGINQHSQIYGLIGDPVEQSLGHIYHNAENRAHGRDAVYLKWRLRPAELEESMSLFRRLGVQGLSVTMPLKEAILPYLSTRLDNVLSIGAANTLRLQPDGWRGANTDGPGAVEALPFSLQGKSVAILGAGGAARAFMHEASQRGAKLLVFNRSANKPLPGLPPGQAIRPLERLGELKNLGYDLIVNALPLDLDFPFEVIPFRSGSLALDLSYNKASRFLELAEAAGCTAMDGTKMFYVQAAIQRAFWGL